MTQAERITALETEVRNLQDTVRDMNEKLDTLIALKYKGAGAFWLASILFGSSVLGLFALVVSWFK